MKNFMTLADLLNRERFTGDKEKCRQYFLNKIGDCQPFVFHAPDSDWQQFGSQGEIDAPFKVFSLEHYEGGTILRIAKDDSKLIFIGCIMAVETGPKTLAYCYISGSILGKDVGNFELNFLVNIADSPLFDVVRAYLSMIGKGKLGNETVRKSIKIKAEGKKLTHRIRRIVHVAPKRYEGDSEISSKIDWSHRFNVRGHWRKTDTLGKDRDGNYCVTGYTWVVDHEKGPEHLPLVKKTRLVKKGGNDD